MTRWNDSEADDQYVADYFRGIDRRPARKPSKARAWNAAEIALLGTMTDREVGIKVGRDGSTVFKQRMMRGIPPWRENHTVTPSAQLLGSAYAEMRAGGLTVAEIATECGVHVGSVYQALHTYRLAVKGGR